MTAPAAVRERLARTWEDAPGVPGFLNTVDHKRIGLRYIVTAFVFFLLGGLQALAMRSQLAVPDNSLVDPQTYNRLFTMHGTTMIFLFNTPILAGFGNYLVPLQIGARDMAFPRLNALGYWIYLLSALLLYASFGVGQVPDAGWFAYVPLSDIGYSPDLGLDFWTLGVVVLGISTTTGGINFIVTIFKLRAPGMSVSRIPLFTWSILVMSFLILFALPAITLGPLLLAFDRILGTAFFDPALGGDPLLYQHLFWFWGHPEVYILFVPATGMISMIIPTFARRPLAGYTWAVASLVAIGFISFGVWVHHMFAVGLPDLANSFFSAAGLVIAVPSGIQIFVWLATLWGQRPRFATPLLFSLGFVLIFVLGGITGVMVSMVPFDWQATDTYFVVAHLHYVLVGGVVFPIFAALYFWLPKVTGWLLGEGLGKVSFWLMFLGFHVAFFPQHLLGLQGMPRRVYTFHAGLGWDVANLISTVGAFAFALGVAATVANLVVSWLRRRPAGPNPWGASSLEWATTSPPADYNFVELPAVRGREPLWEQPHHEGVRAEPGGRHLDVEGEHQTLATAGPEARLEAVLDMPHPSYWPFVLAVSLLGVFTALLLRSFELGVVAFVVLAIALLGWHWPARIPPEDGHG
ncbi:MAG: cytochrome c oxidase subunit I [Egibacteraceae bacterium]